MQLKIRSFGKIKEADVPLEGLTVIAGENDTGKSTVGKLLFCIINELNNYAEDSEDYVLSTCKNTLLTMWKYLARKEYDIPQELNAFIKASKDFNEDFLFFDDIYEKLNIDVRKLSIQTLEYVKNNNLSNDDVLKDDYNLIDFLIHANTKAQLWLALRPKLNQIFKMNLNNSVHSDVKSKISLSAYNSGTDVFSMSVENDKFAIDDFDEEKSKFIWKNVELIESPLMIDSKYSSKIFEKKFLKEMYEDNVSYASSNLIQDIIDANIDIDKKNKSISYQKNNTAKKLDVLNVASGAKSFIILDFLQSLGIFSSDNITVFDEPENHLHPKWQIEYAKLLVNFVQKGANVVLTSHSPYMIQALIHYAKKNNLPEDRFRLLFATKESDNWSSIKDVTKNSDEVFKILTKPFYDIFEG
ncbi:MAG: ATP-binding protein [Endomicrobia bacterium]|nr:ATP-binding protein [Endomicrobiia bacterium]